MRNGVCFVVRKWNLGEFCRNKLHCFVQITFSSRLVNFLWSHLVETRITPHIIAPYGARKIVRGVTKAHAGEIDSPTSSVIYCMEPAAYDTLTSYLSQLDQPQFRLHFLVLLFQICFTLECIFIKWPSFRHNDLKDDNVLIHKSPHLTGYTEYKVRRTVELCLLHLFGAYLCGHFHQVHGKSFWLPAIGATAVIADFGLSCIAGQMFDNYTTVEQEWNNPSYGINARCNQTADLYSLITYLRHVHRYTIPDSLMTKMSVVFGQPKRSKMKLDCSLECDLCCSLCCCLCCSLECDLCCSLCCCLCCSLESDLCCSLFLCCSDDATFRLMSSDTTMPTVKEFLCELGFFDEFLVKPHHRSVRERYAAPTMVAPVMVMQSVTFELRGCPVFKPRDGSSFEEIMTGIPSAQYFAHCPPLVGVDENCEGCIYAIKSGTHLLSMIRTGPFALQKLSVVKLNDFMSNVEKVASEFLTSYEVPYK